MWEVVLLIPEGSGFRRLPCGKYHTIERANAVGNYWTWLFKNFEFIVEEVGDDNA